MNVAITTYSTAQNYGALLQAHALQKYIAGHGHLCDLVFMSEPDERWFKPRKDVMDIFISLGAFEQGKKRIERYRTFRRDYLRYTLPLKDDKSYRQLNSKYHAFVTGSDQVWSCLGRMNPVFYLQFADNDKLKISYAPSFGKPYIPEILKEDIIKALQRFDYISVRERSGAELINDLIGIKPLIVVDPVFLLPTSYWKQLAVPIDKSEYAFVYSTQKSEGLNQAVKQFSKEHPIKIISTHAIPGCKCEVRKDIGPLEFLGYICYAKYVISTSFHATAFSIIFEKDFSTVPHTKTGSRVTELLEDANLEASIWNLGKPFSICDYTDAGVKRLRNRIAASKRYLKESLNDSV